MCCAIRVLCNTLACCATGACCAMRRRVVTTRASRLRRGEKVGSFQVCRGPRDRGGNPMAKGLCPTSNHQRVVGGACCATRVLRNTRRRVVQHGPLDVAKLPRESFKTTPRQCPTASDSETANRRPQPRHPRRVARKGSGVLHNTPCYHNTPPCCTTRPRVSYAPHAPRRVSPRHLRCCMEASAHA